jgi:hypothetical protein
MTLQDRTNIVQPTAFAKGTQPTRPGRHLLVCRALGEAGEHRPQRLPSPARPEKDRPFREKGDRLTIDSRP